MKNLLVPFPQISLAPSKWFLLVFGRVLVVLVVGGVGVYQGADHFLVFCVVFAGLLFEEEDAGPAQGDGDFHGLFGGDEFFGRGQEISDPGQPSYGFIRVH